MNDLFLGNYIAGNFSPKETVPQGSYTLEKRDGVLCLISDKQSTQLTPIDDDAKLRCYYASRDYEERRTEIS